MTREDPRNRQRGFRQQEYVSRPPREDRGGSSSGQSYERHSRPARPFSDHSGPPRRSFSRDGGNGRSGGGPRYGNRFDQGSSSSRERVVPQTYVPAHRLREGLPAAQRAVAELMEAFGTEIKGDYDVTELQISLSFDENGRFIGFGRGGSVSFQLTLTPLDAEEILDAKHPVAHQHEEDEELDVGVKLDDDNDDNALLANHRD